MHSKFETVSMVGLGYIGLPTAAMLASKKIKVIGVDINQHAVDLINRGEIHIVEPGLGSVVQLAVKEGFLRATTTPEAADAFLIAVPTPFKGKFEPDLSYVEAATKSIAHVIKSGDLIVLESTSPVGTTEKISEWLAEIRPDLTFPHQEGCDAEINIAYCPERVLPGKVMHELANNDRVIGGMSKKCSERAISLYKIFVEAECISTNSRTAEMCKLTENSFRDINIAFANELSIISDKLDINVWELIELANHHPRVNILQPGPGVGGHCIAVDPWFIVAKNPNEAKLIHTARVVNDAKPDWVLNKVQEKIIKIVNSQNNKKVQDLTITCFGLSFKADIDDLRESPALEIVKRIASFHSGKTLVVEPHIDTLPSSLEGRCVLTSLHQGLAEADILVLLVDHRVFKENKPKDYQKHQIVDTRGIWI